MRAEAARRFDTSPIGGGRGEPIPADVEAATLAVVAQLLRPGDYDALLERYRAASTPQEEMRSLNALSAFPDIDLALRTFDLAMTEVRSQNGWIVISALLANPVAGQVVWGRITRSRGMPFSIASPRTPMSGSPRRSRRSAVMPDSPPPSCNSSKDHPLASGPRRVAQSVERLGVNVAFADRERGGLADSLGAAVAAATA